MAAHFNRYWVGLWAFNVVALAALAQVLRPGAWAAAFTALFLLPEMVGLRQRGDEYPPLTYVVRRYVPRWVPDFVTFAIGAWVGGLWLGIGGQSRTEHPMVVLVTVASFVGWLTNHWSVTYAGPGE